MREYKIGDKIEVKFSAILTGEHEDKNLGTCWVAESEVSGYEHHIFEEAYDEDFTRGAPEYWPALLGDVWQDAGVLYFARAGTTGNVHMYSEKIGLSGAEVEKFILSHPEAELVFRKF